MAKIADILTNLTLKTEGLISGQTPLRDGNLSKGGKATARFKNTIQGYPIDWEAWEKAPANRKNFYYVKPENVSKVIRKQWQSYANLKKWGLSPISTLKDIIYMFDATHPGTKVKMLKEKGISPGTKVKGLDWSFLNPSPKRAYAGETNKYLSYSDEELRKIAGIQPQEKPTITGVSAVAKPVKKDLSSYSDKELRSIATKKTTTDYFTRGLRKAEEITAPAPLLERAAPGAGQFLGGATGFVAGGALGHPHAGGAIGGTVGRGFGILEARRLKRMRTEKRPLFGTAAEMAFPSAGLVRSFAEMPPDVKKKFGKHMLQTAAIEGVLAGAGNVGTRSLRWLGRGINKQWLGTRVAERGAKEGWAKIMRPDYYKNEVAPFIKNKLSKFFPRLSKSAGEQVKNLIETKYKKVAVNITGVKNKVRVLLPASGNPADLLEMHAPPVQKNLLVNLTNKILKMKGNVRKASTIWELRKEADKTIFGRSWTPDAARYLKGLRDALNEPIKGLGDDVATAFSRYAWVKNAELKYGKNFVVRKSPSGELYSPEIESFAKNLLDPGKDEIIKELSDLDTFLPLPQKIISELLDYAASETLERPLALAGPIGKTVFGFLGGRKFFARIGRAAQRPITQIGKGAMGRLLPTAVSESLEKKP